MKTPIIILLLFIQITTVQVFAQKPVDSLLVGSWQLEKTLPREISGSGTGLKAYISFFRNHVYQVKNYYTETFYIDKVKKDTIAADLPFSDTSYRAFDKEMVSNFAGVWQYSSSEKMLEISHYHPVIPKISGTYNYNYDYGNLTFSIRSISDSQIVIRQKTDKRYYELYYKRVPALPVVADNFVPNRQKNRAEIFLVNSCDTLKKKKLDLNLFYEIDIDQNLPGYEYYHDNLQGNIDSLSHDHLYLSMSIENIESRKKNGPSVKSTIDFLTVCDSINRKDSLNQSLMKRSINPASINYLSFTNDTRETLNTLGGVMLFLSATTALVAAPLVSIDYQHGGFNSSRYFTWAGCGLAGVGVSIPLILLGQGKGYHIGTRGGQSAGDIWFFERKQGID